MLVHILAILIYHKYFLLQFFTVSVFLDQWWTELYKYIALPGAAALKHYNHRNFNYIKNKMQQQ